MEVTLHLKHENQVSGGSRCQAEPSEPGPQGAQDQRATGRRARRQVTRAVSRRNDNIMEVTLRQKHEIRFQEVHRHQAEPQNQARRVPRTRGPLAGGQEAGDQGGLQEDGHTRK